MGIQVNFEKELELTFDDYVEVYDETDSPVRVGAYHVMHLCSVVTIQANGSL